MNTMKFFVMILFFSIISSCVMPFGGAFSSFRPSGTLEIIQNAKKSEFLSFRFTNTSDFAFTPWINYIAYDKDSNTIQAGGSHFPFAEILPSKSQTVTDVNISGIAIHLIYIKNALEGRRNPIIGVDGRTYTCCRPQGLQFD